MKREILISVAALKKAAAKVGFIGEKAKRGIFLGEWQGIDLNDCRGINISFFRLEKSIFYS